MPKVCKQGGVMHETKSRHIGKASSLHLFHTNHYDHTSFRLRSLNDLCYDPPCCLGYKTINTTSHDLLMNSDESVVNHITKPFIVLLILFFFMACPFNRVSCCSSREAR